jgi:sodium/hydrogen antiporter
MHFEDVFAVMGVLLVVGALVAGYAHRTFLSLTALFVVAGFVLGTGGLEVLEFDAQSPFVEILAIVALILILFRDGLEVEYEMLQKAWRPPLRKLVLAMPITCVLVAWITHLLTDLNWTESFLLGALLSPTDPVLSSSVVTNPRVPRVVRHSLNLESGLNDGLALPAVLAFAYALDPSKGDFHWWSFVLQDVTLGFTVGIRRNDIRGAFVREAHDIIEIVKLGVFVVFGSLLTLDGLFTDGAAAVAIVLFTLLFARPIAVLIALVRTRLDLPTRLFMGWFGPKGVATMTFSLLVLAQGIQEGERIFNIAALAVFVSILAHGLTDTPGANAIARHAERTAA